MTRPIIPSSLLKHPATRSPALWNFDDELEDSLSSMQNPGVTLFEDDQCLYIEADLPEQDEHDITITLKDDGMLNIEGKNFLFNFNIALPCKIDENQDPRASITENVLHITLTKALTQKSKNVPITVVEPNEI